MRLVTIFVLLLGLAGRSVATAADTSISTTAPKETPSSAPIIGLRVSPLFLAISAAQFDLEVAATPKLGLGLAGFFLIDGKARLDGKVLNASFNHFGVRATYMLTGRALESGFFLSPTLGYVFGGSSDARDGMEADMRLRGLTIATTVGYQYVSGPGLSFRAGVGARYFSIASEAEGRRGGLVRRIDGPTQDILTPEIDLAVGWVF